MISLPDALLASMRAQAESLMTDTCTIDVQTTAKGDSGETLQGVYAVVASDVPCRLITQSSQTAMSNKPERTGERETLTEFYRLIVPYGTALDVGQRVTITSSGEVFQVIDLISSRTDRVDRQAMIVRIIG